MPISISIPDANIHIHTSYHLLSLYMRLLVCIIYNMKAALGENTLRKDRAGEAELKRLKTSPGQTAAESPKKASQETIMMFNFQQYPFPNGQTMDTPLLKNILNLELSTQKLQRVIKLSHPNIIGLRKIVRSSPKESFEGSRHRSYYSFFYEPVHYGVKWLLEDPNRNMRVFNQIRWVNLRQMLVGVVEYLKEAGIYYLARLQDIGVHADGSIKVYIPPNVVFDSQYNPSIHRAILAIAEWWDTRTKFKKDKDKKILQFQPPRLSDNGDLEFEDPSMKSSTLERELGELLDDAEETKQATELKQSTCSYFSDMAKLGSMQLEKMKRIGEQVKFIRSRLNNEKNKRKHKESDITREKQTGKQKAVVNLFDSQLMAKKEQAEKAENYYLRQPIQQNIHTINIYNHSPSPPNVLAQIPYKYMQKSKNNQVYYQHNLDPEFFADQDEQYSQDTYDIEFENQFEMSNPAPSNKYRHTLFAPPERELSEYSEHCHKKSREGWGSEVKVKSRPQMVQVCNKNVTQSAGPLNFKSFVNKIMKPQFLAKKSNIYEDPLEDGQEETEREAQKNKHEVQKNKQVQQCGRWDQSMPRWEQSMPRRQLADSIQRYFSTEKSLNQFKKLTNKSVNDFYNQKKQDIKRINSQHDFSVSKARFVWQDSQIEQKVRKALEKTKNAIALLNRVKNKGNLMSLDY